MKSRLPIATFINMATVLVGGTIGLLLQQAFPEDVQIIVFQAIGLATLLIGLQMGMKLPDGYLLVLILSITLGGITGELLGIDDMLQRIGDYLKALLNTGNARFTEGLVTATLLFCVGSITIIGAIEEGISGKRDLLLVKATLDGISSVAFAATYGLGVLFAIFPMLLIQGGLTVTAGRMQHFFSEKILNLINAIGGLLIIGIGINLLNIGRVNVENLLPGLVVILPVAHLWDRWFPKTRDDGS